MLRENISKSKRCGVDNVVFGHECFAKSSKSVRKKIIKIIKKVASRGCCEFRFKRDT